MSWRELVMWGDFFHEKNVEREQMEKDIQRGRKPSYGNEVDPETMTKDQVMSIFGAKPSRKVA